MILEPIAEANFRRALSISQNDYAIFTPAPWPALSSGSACSYWSSPYTTTSALPGRIHAKPDQHPRSSTWNSHNGKKAGCLVQRQGTRDIRPSGTHREHGFFFPRRRRCEQTGETLAAWMAEAGFQAIRLPKRPAPPDEPWMNSWATCSTQPCRRSRTGRGLHRAHGHSLSGGTAAARPSSLDRAADRATGPGILDMKAGLVINMFVARALKELDLMPVPMTLTFSPDEELGSPSTTPLLGQVLNGAHAVLCTEPGYPGGGVSVERRAPATSCLKFRASPPMPGAITRKRSAVLEPPTKSGFQRTSGSRRRASR